MSHNGATGIAPRMGDEAYEQHSRALLELMGSVSVTLGSINERMQRTERRNLALLSAVHPVAVPPQSLKVPASQILNIASAELLGPRTGFCWDVRRITVSGLASSSESVTIYRVSSTDSSAAVNNNAVASITGPLGTYAPGLGAFWLRAMESIMIAGTGLTVGEIVVVTADAVAVDNKWVGAYLL